MSQNTQELLARLSELEAENKKLKLRKKYGLIWEEKDEDVVIECKEKLPVLIEKKDKEIYKDSNKETNILIEGDNFHALSVLNYTHKNKIDVIYIDPPYNTGAKDWKYNNDYVDYEDSYRHSKWLSMMEHRLKIAKNLLKKDGVLICAIDDNELGTINLLLDEIFPNKIKNNVVIVHNPHGVSRSGFSRTHEYAIFLLNAGQVINKKPAPEDIRNINLRRSGNNSLRADSPTMFYPIYVNKKNLQIRNVGDVPDKSFHPNSGCIDKGSYFEVWPIDSKGIEKNWYYSKKRVEEKGNTELTCKMLKDQIQISFYHSNNSEQTYKTVWYGSEYDAGAYGASLVKGITNNNFPFPKSLNTVIDCLKAVIKSKNAIVLDFFAGSGTTGHAVMLLNKEDGGNRKFILCTNNENGICEDVTYPRIKKAIEGHKDYLEITKMPTNLKYYKTDFVSAETTDRNKKSLVDKSTEMLCLKEECFNVVKNGKSFKIFTDNQDKYLAVIYDDSGIEQFKLEIKKLGKKAITYMFSLDDSAREEELEDVSKLVELRPIPIAILNVYKRIFK